MARRVINGAKPHSAPYYEIPISITPEQLMFHRQPARLTSSLVTRHGSRRSSVEGKRYADLARYVNDSLCCAD